MPSVEVPFSCGRRMARWHSIMRLIRGLVRSMSRITKFSETKQCPVTLPARSQPPRGRVLFSYLVQPLQWSEDDARFGGHTNVWESREIARILCSFGYEVDAINWNDKQFVPEKKYDVCFDIATNLQRLAPFLDERSIKILHRTGSDPFYQNESEMARVRDLERRHQVHYSPKRLVAYPDLERKSMQIADVCSLKGSSHTLRTYPREFRNKIKLVDVSGCKLPDNLKKEHDYVPSKREFLWFFGSGAVHKGLDLLLEAFSEHTELTLNVVGKLSSEQDFLRIYRHELMELPNIRFHGSLRTDSARFRKIIKDVFCFIAPSCSEGLSPAVVTCLQIGLYPLISRDTGVSLPSGCGTYLEDCTVDEIENAILEVFQMKTDDMSAEITRSQAYALSELSREKFREKMEDFISMAVAR